MTLLTWWCHGALRAVKCGKAAGPDRVSAVLLRIGEVWVEVWLVQLFEAVWREDAVPEGWGKLCWCRCIRRGMGWCVGILGG